MPEERKLVTILFADVMGSTTLGESLDPEDLRALMGRYYAHARRIVDEHGGTLEKFIGDAVMAVFGLPHASSNDAERACAAALALRQSVATDDVLAGRLSLRIGLNTGEAIATDDASSGDFLVTGDAVNVAQRIQALAEPREILASARTAAAAEAGFRCGAPREAQVKGKRAPLVVRAVIEEAEANQLIPHAARMRIVLAQRTGDRAQLERARPVLERLGDRQFLRRLEEVQCALA